ncbi:hypothetical protein [Rhodopila sp.]|uniref:hypothetical protein n=1 Tax=Rhodopila sp. TaxID=2480087 RepID=UPI003D0D382E
MRLGRRPHDKLALARAPSHRFGIAPPPPVLDRGDVAFMPELYSNDIIPDCTAAALANAARGIAALNGFGLVVDQACVPAFYGACAGHPPDLAATDGVVMLDVLQRQASLGFDIGTQCLFGLFGTLDVRSRSALAHGIARLGAGYWGVTLLERDMQRAAVWDVQDGRDDGEIAGGHAVIAWDYTSLSDDGTVRLGTWGCWQRATWAWIAARLDEAHGVCWRQLERADGTFYDRLTADGLVAEITASQCPAPEVRHTL